MYSLNISDFHSFKVVNILTGKIPDKPYAQAYLGLYSQRAGFKGAILICGGGMGSTKKARTKCSVSSKSA